MLADCVGVDDAVKEWFSTVVKCSSGVLPGKATLFASVGHRELLIGFTFLGQGHAMNLHTCNTHRISWKQMDSARRPPPIC